jgi:divalent metal cation (Fe/Co/Zn/Cd) transporter
MRWIGHRLHADVELEIGRGTTLEQADSIAHDAEHALIHHMPKLAQARCPLLRAATSRRNQ